MTNILNVLNKSVTKIIRAARISLYTDYYVMKLPFQGSVGYQQVCYLSSTLHSHFGVTQWQSCNQEGYQSENSFKRKKAISNSIPLFSNGILGLFTVGFAIPLHNTVLPLKFGQLLLSCL
jgi:hypothetical protein